MNHRKTTALWAALAALLVIPQWRAAADPLAHTFSIVARDPSTGDMGVAVQSHVMPITVTS